MIEIYPSGTKIYLKAANINGEIVYAKIGRSEVWYVVSYYYDGDYKNADLMEHEFTTEGNKIQIGFK